MWGQTTASHLPRQGAGHSTGRLDHLALPDCQPIYTQDNNLHHDCPVAESRGEAALCDAPMVKKKRAGAMTFCFFFPVRLSQRSGLMTMSCSATVFSFIH